MKVSATFTGALSSEIFLILRRDIKRYRSTYTELLRRATEANVQEKEFELPRERIARLLTACRASKNPHLWIIGVLAVNTGMRKAEILGLEWERVDLGS